MKYNCIVCGNVLQDLWPQIRTEQGPICMGCEFKEITVYCITLPGEKNKYYDHDICSINNMLKECDYGEGYNILKEKMLASKYFDLPEFTGF